MRLIVEDLYASIPSFNDINDHFFDQYEYVVLGTFTLYIHDLVLLLKGQLTVTNKEFSGNKIIDFVNSDDLKTLIKECFGFIERRYLNNAENDRDVLLSTFFRAIALDENLFMVAKEYFSDNLLKYIITINE